MQCINYIEIRDKKPNGKPYKKGGTRRFQQSTIHHTSEEEALNKGWVRCDGKVGLKVEIDHGGCPCCGEYPSLELNFTCTKCKNLYGDVWTLTGFTDDLTRKHLTTEKFVENLIKEKYDI